MRIIDLGLVHYQKALEEQKRVHAEVCNGALPAAIIVCRHYPVITVGRGAKPGSLLSTRAEYEARGIEVPDAERGGDVTYHSPGQLVVYPVFPMSAYNNDLHAYLRFIEEAIISALAPIGVSANRRESLTGVWVGDRKIASIGIAVKRWISYHGLALIVKREWLDGFSLIRPCGMDIAMTSVESELHRTVSFDDITHRLLRSLTYDQCPAAG
ncbi:MAG: lipoyl(octanoyl) transferase LipB, partial [Candidatus Omnitrophota bacterium]